MVGRQQQVVQPLLVPMLVWIVSDFADIRFARKRRRNQARPGQLDQRLARVLAQLKSSGNRGGMKLGMPGREGWQLVEARFRSVYGDKSIND